MRLRSLPLLVVMAGGLATGEAAFAANQNQHGTCGNTRIDIGFADTLYRALNNNGDGKVGPRRLVVNQTGRIASLGTRLFFQETPMDINRAEIRIVKKAGRARTSVAICSTRANGRQDVLNRFDIPSGNSNVGATFTRTLNGIRNKRVSVRFVGRHATNTMRYEMFFERPNAGEIFEPDPSVFTRLYRPVQGFADLHAHHGADWAYGRGWFFGAMEGPLGADPRSHSKAVKVKLAGIPLRTLRPDHRGIQLPVWSDISHNQMSEAALREAHAGGLSLIVAQAVNSEWMCSLLAKARRTNRSQPCNDMESVKLQILKMKQFDAAHDWYRIVTDPWEARDANYRGQLAVVLGIEASNLFPASDGDWRRQLDEFYDMGVRQVYIAHETNNRFSGAAYHHTEDLALPNQLTAWFSREITYASEGRGRNAVGLTALGKQLVAEMIRRHMVIDIDHVSQRGVGQLRVISLLEDYYPLYAGHTRADALLPPAVREIIPELNTTEDGVRFIRESGGMVGLRTGPEDMLSYGPSGVDDLCAGSVTSLAQTYRYFVDQGVPVSFGSDVNGFAPLTGPRFGPDACPSTPEGLGIVGQQEPSARTAPSGWLRYRTRGLSDIGTLPAVIHDMKFLGADTTSLENSTQAFVRMWTRAYDPNRTQAGP